MPRGVSGVSAAKVARMLAGIDFPARKAQLIEHARRNGAREAVLQALQELPDKEYHTMPDALEAYGEKR